VIKYVDITRLDNEQIAASCEDAADLLEGHWMQGEWYQNIYADDDVDEPSGYAYCLEGGLAAALGMTISGMEDKERKELLSCSVYNAVLETVNRHVWQKEVDAGNIKEDEYREWYGIGDLPNWNDAEGRTEQEVIDLLRKTAKRVLMEDA
jgi:hypothetical protein